MGAKTEKVPNLRGRGQHGNEGEWLDDPVSNLLVATYGGKRFRVVDNVE